MPLFSRSKAHFGLDIGASQIRLVQLQPTTSGKFELTAFGAIDIAPGIFESEQKTDWAKIGGAVSLLVTETRIETRNVVAALPGSVAFTTVVPFPKMSKKEVAKAIAYQAEQYIPMSLDEARLDWQILEGGSPDNLEVLLVAAPLHWVEKYTRILEGAGLKIQALEINPVAVSRSLVGEDTGEVMIADMGQSITDIGIISRGVIRHIRSVNTGGQAMTQAIAQELRVEEPQADEYKNRFGLHSNELEGRVAKALMPPVDLIVNEMDRSRKYFQSDLKGGEVKRLILTGGVANLIGLPEYAGQRLQMAVQLGNPWTQINFPSQLKQKLESEAQSYSIAVGLAMRREE